MGTAEGEHSDDQNAHHFLPLVGLPHGVFVHSILKLPVREKMWGLCVFL